MENKATATTLFDGKGKVITVSNIDVYSMQLENQFLVESYKYTIHWHELTLAMEELVDKGIMKRTESKYDPKPTEIGIEALKLEVVERFGEEKHDKIISDIDLSFMDNKPEL